MVGSKSNGKCPFERQRRRTEMRKKGGHVKTEAEIEVI